MNADQKLEELFIVLPEPRTLPASTVHTVSLGKMLFVSQALPFGDGGRLVSPGRVGVEVRIDAARLAARAAIIVALSSVKCACGGTLDRVHRIVHLEGAVASGADFQDHEKVIDGASELLVSLFGKQGQHTRNVFGVVSLPQRACVSLSLTVSL